MIVCSMFPGDDHEALQMQQHDAYGQALDIMLAEALAHLRRAEALLGPSPLGDLVREDRFDHHVLQDAHDLIAARWRADMGFLQPPLPLAGFHVEKLATEWLAWLRDYMRNLDGRLVRSVLILGYIDPDPEHSEEALLLTTLKEELARSLDRGGHDAPHPGVRRGFFR